MNLDQFLIRSVTFELRYDQNFLHWDRSGRFWSSWLLHAPDGKMMAAAPNEQTFGTPKLRAQSGTERSVITGHGADTNIKEFTDSAAAFTDLVIETLELESFTRLGFRIVYQRRYPDKKSAVAGLLSLNLLNIPTGSHFGIGESEPTDPEFAVRLEGEDLGVLARIKPQELKIQIELPEEFEDAETKRGERKYHELTYDIDLYATKTVLVSQLRTKDWLESAFHAVRRDSHIFLGE